MWVKQDDRKVREIRVEGYVKWQGLCGCNPAIHVSSPSILVILYTYVTSHTPHTTIKPQQVPSFWKRTIFTTKPPFQRFIFKVSEHSLGITTSFHVTSAYNSQRDNFSKWIIKYLRHTTHNQPGVHSSPIQRRASDVIPKLNKLFILRLQRNETHYVSQSYARHLT